MFLIGVSEQFSDMNIKSAAIVTKHGSTASIRENQPILTVLDL